MENLVKAINEGNINKVKDILTVTGKVNQCNEYGKTPLHYAIEAENIEAVKELLSVGADTGRYNAKCSSPMDFAKRAGNQEIIKLLKDAQPVHEGVTLLDCQPGNIDLHKVTLPEAGAADYGFAPLHIKDVDTYPGLPPAQLELDENCLTPLEELETAKELLDEFCGWCDGLVLGAKIEEPRILAEVKVMLCDYIEYLEE